MELFDVSDERWRYRGRDLAMSQARVSHHVYRALLFGTSDNWRITVLGHQPWRLHEEERAAANRHSLRDLTLYQPPTLPVVDRWIGPGWRARTERKVYLPAARTERFDVLHFTGKIPWGEQPLASKAEFFAALDFWPQRQSSAAAKDLLRRTERRRETLYVQAISDFTAQDAMEMLQLPPERVRAIPLAVEHSIFLPDAGEVDAGVRQRWRLPPRYVLYVGSLHARKNVFSLLRAMEILNATRTAAEKLPLVLTGAPGGGHYLKRWLVEVKVRRFLKHTPLLRLPVLDDPELAALYRQATLLVHPSLFEGFGLTVLEAMACGTPVVCGRHSSLAEVGGPAANFVEDVLDAEALADAVAKTAGSNDVRAKARTAGLAHAAKFRWDRFERETLDFVRAAIAPAG